MATNAESHELARNSLGTVEATGMSVAGVGPTVGAALSTTLVASSAGAAAPLSFLLAMFGCLALGFVFVMFSRRVAAAGVAFTYLRSVFGERLGFLGGWMYVGAYLTSTPIILGVGALSASALLAEGGVKVDWFWCFCVLLVLVFALSYLGIKPSVRAQLVVEVVSMSILTVIMVVVLVKGGEAGLSWGPFNPADSPKGISGIGFGLVFAFSAFFGFEASTSLGLETRNPKRSIPIALVTALLVSAFFYVFLAYGLSIGYGVQHGAAWGADPTPLNTITSRFVGGWAASSVDVLVIASAFAASLAALGISSRVMYSMARRGLLPTVVGRVHRRYLTPHVAVTVGSVIALILAVGIGVTLGSEDFIGLVAGSNVLAAIFVYVTVSLAAIVAFAWAGSIPLRIVKVLVPLVAMVLLGFAFYTSVIPQPAFPFNLAPVWAVLWLIIGGAVLLSRVKSRQSVDIGFEDELEGDTVSAGPAR